ncbi:MAG: hypothetical protein QM538_07620, partial [Methylacidiphilales bacterium]|nr:hypothetical protein [Candidatus Methylacidiphilales bacterium]
TLSAVTSITQTSGSITVGASGTISLIATNGNIGSLLNPIIIERTSGNWTSSNLTLKATNGSLFIKTASTGALSALTAATPSITFLPTGTFSLEQTTGSITLPATINFPNATIKLTASATSATIDLSSFNITATSISLTADTNLTTTTGILTSGASGTISLTSTNGNIGSSSNPILITQNAITGDLIATATAGDIYLSSTSSSLTLGAITSATAATNIILISASATNADINVNGGNISGGMITITANRNITNNNRTITVGSTGIISLTATNGSIGSATAPISITCGTCSSWSATSLVLTNSSKATTGIFLTSSNVFDAAVIPSSFTLGTFLWIQSSGTLTLSAITKEDVDFIFVATSGAISISNSITANSISLTAQSITTTSSNNKLTAPTISLIASGSADDIGSSANRVYISSGTGEPDFTLVSVIVASGRSAFLRRDYRTTPTSSNNDPALVDVENEVLLRKLTNRIYSYTVTVFHDGATAFSATDDRQFTVSNAAPTTPQASYTGISAILVGVLDALFALFGSPTCSTVNPSDNFLTSLLRGLCP